MPCTSDVRPGTAWGREGDEALCDEAVQLATEVQRVIVFLGLPGSDESEGSTGPSSRNQIRLLGVTQMVTCE
jgi:hypothetical protein